MNSAILPLESKSGFKKSQNVPTQKKSDMLADKTNEILQEDE